VKRRFTETYALDWPIKICAMLSGRVDVAMRDGIKCIVDGHDWEK
jgi:hypothetical protein